MKKMNLYIIKCYNKAGYPIGDYHVVASGESKAKAALREDERTKGWLGKMIVDYVLSVIITD
jgi:hypothetical protein